MSGFCAADGLGCFVLSGVPPEPAHSELGLPGVAGAVRDTGSWLRELEQCFGVIPGDRGLAHQRLVSSVPIDAR